MAKRTPLPRTIEVELATLVDEPPHGDAWLHEVKFDGYRIVARISREGVSLVSRRGNDWSARFARVAAAVGELGAREAILDGEVVRLLPDGRSDFQSLQNALRDRSSATLHYYVFDLLFLDGHDLRGLPLRERKERLAELLRGRPRASPVRYSDHVVGEGARYFRAACERRLEGTVAKRVESPYRGGRGGNWLKTKCTSRQEVVIGGFTRPRGSRSHLGALHVGLFRQGKLEYVGKVGTGFSEASLRELRARLRPLERPTSPFEGRFSGAAFRETCWVDPVLVAEVEFTEFTSDGKLRHPSFQGLRDDKVASDVSRETPAPRTRSPRQGRRAT